MIIEEIEVLKFNQTNKKSIIIKLCFFINAFVDAYFAHCF